MFVLGPFMMWAGSQSRGLPDWARGALLVGGLATVLYNAQNYLEVQSDDGGGI